MKKPKAKRIKVRGKNYKIQYVSTIDHCGDCTNRPRIIRINKRMGAKMQWKTLIHEVQHAITYEYNVKIKHSLIYKLEKPLLRLLIENGLLRI